MSKGTPQTSDLLAAIARDLAARDAPVEPLYGLCLLCARSVIDMARTDDHDATCPWRRARGWVASR